MLREGREPIKGHLHVIDPWHKDSISSIERH